MNNFKYGKFCPFLKKKTFSLSFPCLDLVPVFQLCSFLTRSSPSGLKGPFSENAPTPREEQPGPTHEIIIPIEK